MKRFNIILITFAACLSLVSCSSSKPICIDERLDDLVLRFGYISIKSGEVYGYEIDSYANIYTITKVGTNYNVRKKIGKIDDDKYCNYVKQIRSEFLNVQALHSPGDTSRFVEYVNIKMNIQSRAVWNPKFQTVMSKGFREIFDSLEVEIGEFSKK